MNERIEKLVTASFPGTSLGVLMMYSPELSKFAELIVRECADICVGVGEQEDSPYGSIAWDCAEKLKKNFGVN